MNLSAITHTLDGRYIMPLNKDELLIRIKTGKDVKKVTLIAADPYLKGIAGADQKWEGQPYEMEAPLELPWHHLFQITFRPPYKRLRYYFKLETETETFYKTADGLYSPRQLEASRPYIEQYKFPWMNESDIVSVPLWPNETIWYQIFVDRFCPVNPPAGKSLSNWQDLPQSEWDCFGGTLQGITSKLDYLQSLGINGLYLTPIFQSPTNHKYDTEDYTRIDPDFGSLEDFKQLVDESHKRGMKVMIDAVFNHCGSTFGLWQDVARNQEASPYKDWFIINRFPFSPKEDPHEGGFYTFAFSNRMPKLNTNNPEVQDWCLSLVRNWVKNWHVDGIRFDVGNEISHSFLKRLRKEVKSLNPEVYLLGEIWHDSFMWMQGDEYDAVMNYPLGQALERFWLDESESASALAQKMNEALSLYHPAQTRVAFNLLDSHDTQRLITLLEGDLDAFFQILMMELSLPGSVCLYYGTEIALPGSFDPDCRRTMPWKDMDTPLLQAVWKEVQALIALRKNHSALRQGVWKWKEDPNPRVILLERMDDKEHLLLAVNGSQKPWKSGTPLNVLHSRLYKNGILEPKGFLLARL